MTSTNKSSLGEGWNALWKSQRVLWWIFFVNLLVGLLASAILGAQLAPVLDHSLRAQDLYHGFDLGAAVELVSLPEANLSTVGMAALLLSIGFLVFMIFFNGGILETYRQRKPLAAGEFFQACGGYFWRMVRLLLWMSPVVAIIMGTSRGLVSWSDKLAGESPRPLLGFYVRLVTDIVTLLLLMAVRLWFDMAQVRAVVENERAMTRAASYAFRQTFGNFGSLFWIYFRITLIAWIALALALLLWQQTTAESTGLKFLLGEAVIFVWIGTRLWQRSSEMAWYQAWRVVPSAPVSFTPEDLEPAAPSAEAVNPKPS